MRAVPHSLVSFCFVESIELSLTKPNNQMKLKTKLKLDDIKVESFITSIEGMSFQGAGATEQTNCTSPCYCAPVNPPGAGCASMPYPCQSGSDTFTYNTLCNQYTCYHNCGTSQPGTYTQNGT